MYLLKLRKRFDFSGSHWIDIVCWMYIYGYSYVGRRITYDVKIKINNNIDWIFPSYIFILAVFSFNLHWFIFENICNSSRYLQTHNKTTTRINLERSQQKSCIHSSFEKSKILWDENARNVFVSYNLRTNTLVRSLAYIIR